MQLSVIQMPSTPCHSIGKLINMSIQKKKKTNAVFLLGRDLFWQQLVRTKSYELSIRALVKFCGWGTVIKATKPARWEYTLFFLTLLYAYSKHCIQAIHELHKNLQMFTLAQCNAHGQKWCPRCQKNQNSKIEKLYRVVQTDKKGNSENWHLKAFLYYRRFMKYLAACPILNVRSRCCSTYA